jgi:hypothetical protein
LIDEQRWTDLAHWCEKCLTIEEADHIRGQFYMGIAFYKLNIKDHWKTAINYFSGASDALQQTSYK